DTKTGRWTTEDPKGFDAGDYDLDRYVHNSPTNATDPSGLSDKPLASEEERQRIILKYAFDGEEALTEREKQVLLRVPREEFQAAFGLRGRLPEGGVDLRLRPWPARSCIDGRPPPGKETPEYPYRDVVERREWAAEMRRGALEAERKRQEEVRRVLKQATR